MTDLKHLLKPEPHPLTNALQNLAASLIVIAVVVIVCLALVQGLDKEAAEAVTVVWIG
jgi:hypothetical protein